MCCQGSPTTTVGRTPRRKLAVLGCVGWEPETCWLLSGSWGRWSWGGDRGHSPTVSMVTVQGVSLMDSYAKMPPGEHPRFRHQGSLLGPGQDNKRKHRCRSLILRP